MSDAAHLLDLVQALEARWVDPQLAEPSGVAALLEERQCLLVEIEATDWSAVELETRRLAAERIGRVRERDSDLLSVLLEARDELARVQDQLVTAREAARGYAAGEPHTPATSFDRKA